MKNRFFEREDGSVGVELTRGLIAVIEKQDVLLVRGYRWTTMAAPNGRNYAVSHTTARGKKTAFLMHRVILGASKGQELDHKNRDGLDNRRANLRFCTHSQNQGNRKKQAGSSQFKGVFWDPDRMKWRAAIKVGGKLKKLGRFDSEAEAARTYDTAAKEGFGEFARCNAV